MENKVKNLLVVAGPTAVGKTAFAIELARYLHTEIISADSRQFYKELNIGTAKPSADELRAVRHHFIGHISIHEAYNAGRFETEALSLIQEKFKTCHHLVLTGGSGMFIRAVCEGMDEIPPVDPDIRASLNNKYLQEGLAPLLEQLRDLDSDYFDTVDKNNPQRIIRALEVCLSADKPFSSFRTGKSRGREFNIIKIGLDLPRKELYDRVNARVDGMMQSGLLEEAKALWPFKHLNALHTVGYSELFDCFEDKISYERAVELIKQHTRHYAKRQLTWFRKEEDMQWFQPDQIEEVKTFISSKQDFKM